MLRHLLPAVIAIALTACVSTPSPSPETPVTQRPTASVTGGLATYMEQRARVERVGFRLRKAAAADCAERKQTKQDIGLIVWSLRNFQNAQDRMRLQSDFALTDAVTVALAVDGAPAASAGIANGAIITHVNGDAVGEGKGATERYIARAAIAASKAPSASNSRAATTSPYRLTRSASSRRSLCEATTKNAAADGTVLAITSGLLKHTSSDDEIALILGHELAHKRPAPPGTRQNRKARARQSARRFRQIHNRHRGRRHRQSPVLDPVRKGG